MPARYIVVRQEFVKQVNAEQADETYTGIWVRDIAAGQRVRKEDVRNLFPGRAKESDPSNHIGFYRERRIVL